MMAKLRYRAMYVTSTGVGYLLAGVMLMLGARFREDVRAIVRETAREHAAAAERKEGPYLAPVTMLALACAVMTLLGIGLVRLLS